MCTLLKFVQHVGVYLPVLYVLVGVCSQLSGFCALEGGEVYMVGGGYRVCLRPRDVRWVGSV